MRLKQRIHAVISWRWTQGYCTSNPVDVVDYLLPAQPSKTIRTQHHPAMAWRDMQTTFEKLKYHKRTEDGYSIQTCAVEGKSTKKSARVSI